MILRRENKSKSRLLKRKRRKINKRDKEDLKRECSKRKDRQEAAGCLVKGRGMRVKTSMVKSRRVMIKRLKGIERFRMTRMFQVKRRKKKIKLLRRSCLMVT